LHKPGTLVGPLSFIIQVIGCWFLVFGF